MENMTVRNAWLGIKDGYVDLKAKETIFVAQDGRWGQLVKCHICGNDAHPDNVGSWMFRLEGDETWYWEWELTPIPSAT